MEQICEVASALLLGTGDESGITMYRDLTWNDEIHLNKTRVYKLLLSVKEGRNW